MKTLSAKQRYFEKVIPALREQFGYKNVLQVPRITKIVVNCGIGKITKENDRVEEVVRSLEAISGQKSLLVAARKAIAGFKVREGQHVGVSITLRGKRMWDFIDRLNNTALPRTRDFQGITLKSIDAKGNLSIGIKEHTIFPEIFPEKVKHIFSFQVTIPTTAKTREEGIALLRLLGFPLKNDSNK